MALLVASCTAPTPVPTATPRPTATATLLPTATPLALEACGEPSKVSAIETPVPVTPTTPRPTPTPAASPTSPPPTATPRPAPQTDRVGFPEGYKTDYKRLYVFDRFDAKSVSYICGNDAAATVKPGEPFPYGSILVFESWRPREDPTGNLLPDENSHLVRQTLNAIFVMRKGKGYGEAYQDRRSGEWEFVAYRPDKSYQTAPQGSAVCSSCHLAGAGQGRDFVFRPQLIFVKDRYARSDATGAGEIGLSRMAFAPNTFTVKAGTTVKWVNSKVDGIDHTVTAADNAFDSGVLKPGASFSFTFNAPGTYQYFCALHPEQMRARIQVTG